MIKKDIQTELNKLKQKEYINKDLVAKFENRLNEDIPLLRDEHSPNHFCVFFIPYHKKTNSVFIGHHVKANLWIPPGGHVDTNETLTGTAIREIYEELQYKANPRELDLI